MRFTTGFAFGRWRLVALTLPALLLGPFDGMAPSCARAQTNPAPPAEQRFRATVQAYERALEALEREGAEASPATQWMLSAMFLSGNGAPRDPDKAMQWLRRAAEGGHAEAQYQLGSAYDIGLGLPQDPVRAATWMEIAAARGHEAARAARHDASARLSPEQRGEVRRMARAWLDAHADAP